MGISSTSLRLLRLLVRASPTGAKQPIHAGFRKVRITNLLTWRTVNGRVYSARQAHRVKRWEMTSRQLVRVLLLIVALLALGTSAPADTRVPAAVPEASVFVLAPMGIAAVLAAEKRRRLARIRSGVGAAYFAVKRTIDVVLAAAFLLACFPLAMMVALLVRFDSPGPIVYKRRVIGKGGRCFDMYKFLLHDRWCGRYAAAG